MTQDGEFRKLLKYNIKPSIDNIIFRPIKLIWHGSNKDGTFDKMHNCLNWRTAGAAVTGQATYVDSNLPQQQQPFTCSRNFIVLCIENTARTLSYKK